MCDWRKMGPRQRTIREGIALRGRCFYSGDYSTFTIQPAPEDSGVIFELGTERVPVSVEYIHKDKLHTTSLLLGDGRKVRMVEHVLSALYGLHIDNATIKLGTEEMPYVSCPSAIDYARALIEVGIIEQRTAIDPLVIDRTVGFEWDRSWAILRPYKRRCLHLIAEIEFPEPIGKQDFEYTNNSPKQYCGQISWARNFLTSNISDRLPNGRTYWMEKRSQIAVLPENPIDSPIPCFDKGRWICHPLKPDEIVRHKVLDFLGDISLIGKRVWGEIFVHYPGHAFNQQLAKFIIDNFR